MQIKVAESRHRRLPFNLAACRQPCSHKADGTGVFESSQNPIIVGQGAYNSAYGTTFQHTRLRWTDYAPDQRRLS